MKKSVGLEGLKTAEGLSCFEVTLSVKYKTPLPFTDSTGGRNRAAGYFTKFLVVAASEHQACQLVSSEVEDGEIDWQDSELKQMSMSDLTEYSLGDHVVLSKPGIVFRSSHFLYPSTRTRGLS